MKLTSADIERYAPYHTMPAFEAGYKAYNEGCNTLCPYGDTVDGQAWDRGAECAMRHARWREPFIGCQY